MENESCLNRIIAKSESQNATVTERKIALYIKENLEKVLHCNLLELAELIGMSDRIMVMCEGNYSGEVKREEFSQERIMTLASAIKV